MSDKLNTMQAQVKARHVKLFEHMAHGVTLFVWPGTMRHLNRLHVSLDTLCTLIAKACYALDIPVDYLERVNVSVRQGVNTTTTGSWNDPVRWLEVRIGTSDDPELEELRGTIWHELRHGWQGYHNLCRDGWPGDYGSAGWVHYMSAHEYDALLWEAQVCASARSKLLVVNTKRAHRHLSVAPPGATGYFGIEG